MKKLILISTILAVAFSYSCNKEAKKVSTSFSGQLRTNGTEDVIKMSTVLPTPTVEIYQTTTSSTLISGGGYEKVTSMDVDKNGNFSFDLDLYEDETYFFAVSNLNTSIYYQRDTRYCGQNSLKPGQSNNKNIYISAKSWVLPRFINTNPDPNNQDVFVSTGGIGGGGVITTDPIFYGPTDTIMPWIYKTWSGSQKYGTFNLSNSHYVSAKLTRNGVTNDITIPYTVPTFDTTVVEIKY